MKGWRKKKIRLNLNYPFIFSKSYQNEGMEKSNCSIQLQISFYIFQIYQMRGWKIKSFKSISFSFCNFQNFPERWVEEWKLFISISFSFCIFQTFSKWGMDKENCPSQSQFSICIFQSYWKWEDKSYWHFCHLASYI